MATRNLELVAAEHALRASPPHRISSNIPAPTLVLAVFAFLATLILAFMRASLVAKGHQLAAAALGQFVSGAMVVAVSGVFTVVSVVATRMLGNIVVERKFAKRQHAEQFASELLRYQKREESLKALANAVRRERERRALPLAS